MNAPVPKEPTQDGLPTLSNNFGVSFRQCGNWIKHGTEAEGTTANTILLRNAIAHEYTWGYATLPRTLYSSYFTITLDTSLLTTATIYQKQWYTLIKLAREQSHSDTLDEFLASSSLCAWVGLPLCNIYFYFYLWITYP